MDIGEAHVEALEFDREFFVIKAQKVKQGRMEVVNVDGILSGVEPEFVRGPKGETGFHAAAREPHGESVRVVITAVVAALNHRRATELTAPDDDGVLEESALLQITHQSGTGLVGLPALFGESLREAAVVIPGLVEELNEANPTLDQAAGEDAVIGEGGLSGFGTVHVEDVPGFA